MRLAITRSAPDSSDLRNQCPTDRIQIFTRQAKKALDVKINKTDANDAEGLTHLVRSGWYREVRVKSREAMLARALIGARSSQLLGTATDLSNQIRGPDPQPHEDLRSRRAQGQGRLFDRNVRAFSPARMRSRRP